jgi:hypothetical protein
MRQCGELLCVAALANECSGSPDIFAKKANIGQNAGILDANDKEVFIAVAKLTMR